MREHEPTSTVSQDRAANPEVIQVRESLKLRFIRQAPFLPAATDLAVASCPITPWPHQLRVVRHVTARFPESFLFADEVGLGKTIEAGWVLRQLLISGRIRRALLLVPKGISRQWQEELYEKLVLDIPRYEGGRFFDVRGNELIPREPTENPWNQFPVLLASSQLAKQQPRRAEILDADSWDVVLVDEAHHARRRGSGSGSGRPNALLELLAGRSGQPGLKDRCRCLYLLTATPMQVHAVEVWDLLKLLGMGGRWGSSEEEFLRYFEELRRPFEDRDWSTLLSMQQEVMGQMGTLDPAFVQWARESLGGDADAVEALLSPAAVPPPSSGSIEAALQALTSPQREVLDRGLRRHTPLRARAWRHTRGLLRAYRRAGWTDAAVPRRRTHNEWIALRPREKDLYDRIEAFVCDFYQRYEARRQGLGFAMTLYRRRLTSSFYAVRRSLERRLLALRQASEGLPLDPSETEDDDDFWDVPAFEPGAQTRSLFDMGDQAPAFSDEIVFLEDFLARLQNLPADSKLDRLLEDLDQILAVRDRVLVFTQYTDTMDFLRRALAPIYGRQVACYSGRGGEIQQQDGTWGDCPKETLKESFLHGDIKVLLCTEAAGEGLNLQTCGVLINFDMPWNPMRIEQRIGRIDRIGQRHDEVWIRNYFYRDTVEAEIFRRLSHRIGWFEEVVGTLQPILHNVGESIRRLAMIPAGRRARQLEEEVHRLDGRWETGAASAARVLEGCFEDDPDDVDLDARMTEGVEDLKPPPVTAKQLEKVMTESTVLPCRWTPVPGESGTYDLDWQGSRHRVTFDPSAFERRPYSVSMLTYGQPLFEQLLEESRRSPDLPSPEPDLPMGVGLYRTREPAPVSLFFAPLEDPTSNRDDGLTTLEDLRALEEALRCGRRAWSADEESAASARFSRRRRQVLRQQTRVEQRRRRAHRSALVESARLLLVQASQVDQAMARRPGLFEALQPLYLGASAVAALKRHGEPFVSLLEGVAGDILPVPSAKAAFSRRLEGKSLAYLQELWSTLTTEGMDLLVEIERVQRRIEEAESTAVSPSAGGMLERLWFPLGGDPLVDDAPRPSFLAPDTVRPFVNGVPFYEDLHEVIDRLHEAHGPEPQRALARRPDSVRWLALEGRFSPRPDLCVVPVRLPAMGRLVPLGSLCLLRLRPRGPWQGKVLLLEHPDIDDDALAGSFTLRRYESRGRASRDGSWRPPQIFLHGAPLEGEAPPQILEDVEEGTLWIHAELLEVLT